MSFNTALLNATVATTHIRQEKDQAAYNSEERTRAKSSTLFQASFIAFAVWLLLLPQVAAFSSTTIYSELPLSFLPFVVAFILFAMLASAKKLPRVHIVATGASVAACALGLVFVCATASQVQLLSFCALMVLAAYLLVAWGGVLRHVAAKEAFALLVKGLLAVGAFRILVSTPYIFSGGIYNQHAHALFVLALLALLPLIAGLYFALTIPRQGTYREFDDGAGNAGSSKRGDFYLNWRRGFSLPSVIILFVASILVMTFNGFVYSPYLFSQIELDLMQGLMELLVAGVELALLRALQKRSKGAQFDARFTRYISVVFDCVLLLVIVGLSLTLLGQVGAFISQTILRALGNVLFVLIIFFAIAPTSKSRKDFFPRLLLSVVCSGMLWAFALGSAVQRLIGYDAQTIASAAAMATVAIAFLFVLALMNARSLHQNFEERAVALQQAANEALEQASQKALQAAAANSKKQAQTAAPQQNDFAWSSAEIKKACVEALAPYSVSRRELQVASLLLEGITAQTIAERLELSPGTVRGYTKSLYRKTNVNSKAMLISLIIKEN